MKKRKTIEDKAKAYAVHQYKTGWVWCIGDAIQGYKAG